MPAATSPASRVITPAGETGQLVNHARPRWARAVVRSPEDLRIHRSLVEFGPIDIVEELNRASLVKEFAADAILVTPNNIILAGFGRWLLAIMDGKHAINCTEYPLTDDESLEFILAHHRPQPGWNDFARIRLALTLEPYFQQRALDNMRAGGRYKGSANLPDAQRIDVRSEIARVAGVGQSGRNVSNVKTILNTAHRHLIAALQDGRLTINHAMRLCKLPKDKQFEQFIRDCEERAAAKVIRRAISLPDPAVLLNALQLQVARRPELVQVRVGALQRTLIIVGQDLLSGRYSQEELKLT